MASNSGNILNQPKKSLGKYALFVSLNKIKYNKWLGEAELEKSQPACHTDALKNEPADLLKDLNGRLFELQENIDLCHKLLVDLTALRDVMAAKNDGNAT